MPQGAGVTDRIMARGSFLLLAEAVAAQDFHGVPHPRARRQAPAVYLRGDRYGGRYHGLDEAQYIKRRQEGEAQVAHARETGELSAALEAELVEGKDCWWEGARAASLDRAVLFSFCRRFAAQATSGKTSSSAATARGSATRARPAPRRDIRGLLRERLCFARRTWLAKCCAWGENGGFWWPFECCGCYQGGPFENWVVSFNGWDRLPHPVGRPRRGVDHH